MLDQNHNLKIEQLKDEVLKENYCEIALIINEPGYNRSLLKSYCEAKIFRYKYKKDTLKKSLDIFKLSSSFFFGAIASDVFLQSQSVERILLILFGITAMLGVLQVAIELFKKIRFDNDEYIYSILLKFL